MNALVGRSLAKRAVSQRTYSSLREIIPPNIGFAARAGESASESVGVSSQKISKLVSLYRNLPKGQAEPKPVSGGLISRYRARYIDGDNASAAPIGHVIGLLLVGGYSIHYFMHLKHHKSAEHH